MSPLWGDKDGAAAGLGPAQIKGRGRSGPGRWVWSRDLSWEESRAGCRVPDPSDWRGCQPTPSPAEPWPGAAAGRGGGGAGLPHGAQEPRGCAPQGVGVGTVSPRQSCAHAGSAGVTPFLPKRSPGSLKIRVSPQRRARAEVSQGIQRGCKVQPGWGSEQEVSQCAVFCRDVTGAARQTRAASRAGPAVADPCPALPATLNAVGMAHPGPATKLPLKTSKQDTIGALCRCPSAGKGPGRRSGSRGPGEVC